MTGETVWLDDLVEEALHEGRDVRLALDGHNMGFHVVIDGERVTGFLYEGLAWEILTLEMPEGDSR